MPSLNNAAQQLPSGRENCNGRTGRLHIFIIRLTVTVGLLSILSTAAVNESCLSIQGYTGVINTPNAHLIPDGRMTLLYTNQVLPRFLDRYPDIRFNTMVLTAGFLSCMEITGRFMNSLSYPARGPRDLSADVKLGYDFSTFNTWFPSAAAGIQDVSGGAVHLSTKYFVLSEEIGPVRLSGGYGGGPSRMEGLFWGAELFLTPYLHLLADNDNDEAAVALRLLTPQNREYTPFTATLLLKSVYREKTPLFTFSAAVSCDMHKWNFPGMRSLFANEKRGGAGPDSDTPVKKPEYISEDIARRLSGYGLQNITVETVDSTLVVQYENNHFNYNETDALGIVLGAVCTSIDLSIDTVTVTVLRSRLPVLTINTDREGYCRFLHDGDASAVYFEVRNPEVRLFNRPKRPVVNSSTGRIRCELSPRLRYFLGTEVGAFDYQVGVNCDAYMQLWPGGTVAARTAIPVWNTENMDRNRAFSAYREHVNLNSAAFYQFVNIGYGVTTLFSTGLYTAMFERKYFSVVDDIRFTGKTGFFRCGIQGGYFTRDGYYRAVILSYMGLQLPKDLFLEMTGGVFWEQDTGVDVSLTRRIRDVDLKFFCKRTKNYRNEFDTFVGARITLPLTPRRGMKPWYLTVSGKEDWSTSIATRYVTGNGRNSISTACGMIPDRLLTLGADYYSRDRLNGAYIRQNSSVLRQAWIENR